MIGLSVELKQPNQRHKLIIKGLILHAEHVGRSIASIKNGSQQQTKAPVNKKEEKKEKMKEKRNNKCQERSVYMGGCQIVSQDEQQNN